MKSLRKSMVILAGATLALGMTGCGQPNAEMQPAVVEKPRPDAVPAAPRATQDHPDIR